MQKEDAMEIFNKIYDNCSKGIKVKLLNLIWQKLDRADQRSMIDELWPKNSRSMYFNHLDDALLLLNNAWDCLAPEEVLDRLHDILSILCGRYRIDSESGGFNALMALITKFPTKFSNEKSQELIEEIFTLLRKRGIVSTISYWYFDAVLELWDILPNDFRMQAFRTIWNDARNQAFFVSGRWHSGIRSLSSDCVHLLNVAWDDLSNLERTSMLMELWQAVEYPTNLILLQTRWNDLPQDERLAAFIRLWSELEYDNHRAWILKTAWHDLPEEERMAKLNDLLERLYSVNTRYETASAIQLIQVAWQGLSNQMRISWFNRIWDMTGAEATLIMPDYISISTTYANVTTNFNVRYDLLVLMWNDLDLSDRAARFNTIFDALTTEERANFVWQIWKGLTDTERSAQVDKMRPYLSQTESYFLDILSGLGADSNVENADNARRLCERIYRCFGIDVSNGVYSLDRDDSENQAYELNAAWEDISNSDRQRILIDLGIGLPKNLNRLEFIDIWRNLNSRERGEFLVLIWGYFDSQQCAILLRDAWQGSSQYIGELLWDRWSKGTAKDALTELYDMWRYLGNEQKDAFVELLADIDTADTYTADKFMELLGSRIKDIWGIEIIYTPFVPSSDLPEDNVDGPEVQVVEIPPLSFPTAEEFKETDMESLRPIAQLVIYMFIYYMQNQNSITFEGSAPVTGLVSRTVTIQSIRDGVAVKGDEPGLSNHNRDFTNKLNKIEIDKENALSEIDLSNLIQAQDANDHSPLMQSKIKTDLLNIQVVNNGVSDNDMFQEEARHKKEPEEDSSKTEEQGKKNPELPEVKDIVYSFDNLISGSLLAGDSKKDIILDKTSARMRLDFYEDESQSSKDGNIIKRGKNLLNAYLEETKLSEIEGIGNNNANPQKGLREPAIAEDADGVEMLIFFQISR